jgi:hypothetical protein
MLRLAIVVLTISLAWPVLAQERATEASSLTHVYDDVAQWESDVATIPIRLEAPADLVVCRQGRIVSIGSERHAHMGCWPPPAHGVSLLDVPPGPAFIGVRHGLDLVWIGDGPVELHGADVLRVSVDDRLPIRIVGWVTAAVSLVAGAILFGVSFTTGRNQTAVAITGVAIAVVGMAVGFGLTAVGDGFRLTLVRPTITP